MVKKTSCEIVLGSYEEFILGFKYNKKEEEAQQTFAVHSHVSSIRCVTTAAEYLASGGADDRIVVYNLKTRKEHCLLTHHKGTVTCLQFINGHTHLLSGGQDGMLAICRVGNWQLEKVWENAHKGAAIIDIAVHSSGKLALSLGADSTLRTWNLIKGRQAYVINLNSKSKEPKSLHTIKWAPDGTRFVLAGNSYTDVWSIDSGGILKSIKHEQKVSSCHWYTDDQLVVGYEDGKFGMVDIDTEEIVAHEAHSSRVKCLALHGSKLVTASSTGEIKVWSAKFKQLCVANAGCRFTCMCLVTLDNEDLQDLENEDVEDVPKEETSPAKKLARKHVVIEVEEENLEYLVNKKTPKKKLDIKGAEIEDSPAKLKNSAKLLKKKKKSKVTSS